MKNNETQQNELRHREKFYRKLALWLTIFLSVFAIFMFFWNRFWFRSIGPEQPIPFSHRVHAGKKEISCVMCHPGVIDAPRAGMPPQETCMLCHRHIIINLPHIQHLRQTYYNKEPIKWVRIARIPDYVNFNHQVHFRASVDCSACHGNIKEMDRVYEVTGLSMGFCLQCHRDSGATIDCFTCHH